MSVKACIDKEEKSHFVLSVCPCGKTEGFLCKQSAIVTNVLGRKLGPVSGFIVAFKMTAAVFPWKLTLYVDADRICISKIEYLCDTWCVCLC